MCVSLDVRCLEAAMNQTLLILLFVSIRSEPYPAPAISNHGDAFIRYHGNAFIVTMVIRGLSISITILGALIGIEPQIVFSCIR